MYRYSFQAMDNSGEPVADETSNQVSTKVGEETIREHARQIAQDVTNEFGDEAPWAGWYVQVYSKDGDEDWEQRTITFEDLMGEPQPD